MKSHLVLFVHSVELVEQLLGSLKMIIVLPSGLYPISFSTLSSDKDNFFCIWIVPHKVALSLLTKMPVLTTWVFWCQNLQVSQLSHPASSAFLFLSWVVVLKCYSSWISVCAVLLGWSLELFTGVLVMSGLQSCQRQKAGFSVKST